MARSRSFSIYLLKSGFNATNSLRDDHPLESDAHATRLPEGAVLYVLDSSPRPPWWRGYFGIRKMLLQQLKGALVFVPAKGRWFALSFGHVSHNLKDVSYEYDFGIRVTLNSVDPTKLKSTDVLEPGVARRRRTQIPVESDLTFFDFDRDSTILRSLTGKIADEHRELFKHATGANNLRISSDVASEDLKILCERLLELYDSEKFKETFPNIQNITPVRDPAIVERLNSNLLVALRGKDEALNLTVPDIINYSDNVYATFSGAGKGQIYDDVYIGSYYEYLTEREVNLAELNINDVRKHALVLTDEEGGTRERYSIYKSLIFDTTLSPQTYHLAEGNWYKIEPALVDKLHDFLDPLCTDIALPSYNHESEGTYNLAVAAANDSIVCLDTKNISPPGETQIEPCDLYSVDAGLAVFQHVKVSTLSNQLSHLFNQGTNAIELIKLEPVAVERLKTLLTEAVGAGNAAKFIAPLDAEAYEVIFVMITRKDKLLKSNNIPLFSQMSLMRNMKALQMMNVKCAYGFVKNEKVLGA
jgi:uncharacterized protein (TIGR04141 family)